MVKILLAEDSSVCRAIQKEIINLSSKIEYSDFSLSIDDLVFKAKKNPESYLICDFNFFKKEKIEDVLTILKEFENSVILFVQNEKFVNFSTNRIAILKKPDFLSFSKNDSSNFLIQLEKICDNFEKNKSFCFLNSIKNKITKIKNDEELNIKPKDFKAVLIGVSTGGPTTIQKLLSEFDSDFPLPIFITQHIDYEFDKSLISWLDSMLKLSVRFAEDNLIPQKGNVYFAPTDFHLVFDKNENNQIVMKLSSDDVVNFLRPAVDKMFFSAAKIFKNNSISILLTGMGSDGAKGLLALKNAGSYTITESEKSCVVYGMPKVAYELGASLEQLSIEEISKKIKKLAGCE